MKINKLYYFLCLSLLFSVIYFFIGEQKFSFAKTETIDINVNGAVGTNTCVISVSPEEINLETLELSDWENVADDQTPDKAKSVTLSVKIDRCSLVAENDSTLGSLEFDGDIADSKYFTSPKNGNTTNVGIVIEDSAHNIITPNAPIDINIISNASNQFDYSVNYVKLSTGDVKSGDIHIPIAITVVTS